MVLGGALAAFDRRYRQAHSPARAAHADAPRGAGVPAPAPGALGAAATAAKGAMS